MFEGQPKGLYALALANTGERFGYYTMLAVFCIIPESEFLDFLRRYQELFMVPFWDWFISFLFWAVLWPTVSVMAKW